ncbi:PHP-associated domain-containing protein [Thermohalobacter berrensis]|uniref:PHP-associated domain-containing protein n=1 Tax=Thermohalobacter berrensis TaxID=99594 RepID=UPI000E7471DE|nr:PHP-associated domain-containing protein [Thermohalobacter berrensis]
MIYKDNLLVILGSELEVNCNKGSYHIVAYFPSVDNIERFSNYVSKYIKNINLSSQKVNVDILKILQIVSKLNGILIPAHIFTPFKGIYGRCTKSIKSLVGEYIFKEIPAVELGLSGDTFLASLIKELDEKTLLSNSDAHSLPKIGREYNVFKLENLSYESFVNSLFKKGNNRVLANYGLNPKLGKYHRSYCLDCKKASKKNLLLKNVIFQIHIM